MDIGIVDFNHRRYEWKNSFIILINSVLISVRVSVCKFVCPTLQMRYGRRVRESANSLSELTVEVEEFTGRRWLLGCIIRWFHYYSFISNCLLFSFDLIGRCGHCGIGSEALSREARESVSDQVTVGVKFASDWLRGWCIWSTWGTESRSAGKREWPSDGWC